MKGPRALVCSSILALGVSFGLPQSPQAKPADAEIDRAIQDCSSGTATDDSIAGGLNLLRQRILAGEGGLAYSEIPAAIGVGLKADTTKIPIFDKIQQCV